MTEQDKYTLLVIDDNPETIKNFQNMLDSDSYIIKQTPNGTDGYNLLINQPELFAAVILGKDIKCTSSIELLHKINSSSVIKKIPVIIEASTGSMEEIEQCIRAGARYCIPESIDQNIMSQIIATAIRDQIRYKSAEQSALEFKAIGHTLTYAKFKLKTLDEAQLVANLMAGECPNPCLAAVGITEMLINAIEHGNLNISYAEKTKLYEQEKWLTEIERRLLLAENKDKFITIIFDKSSSHINIRIIDQGKGFNWREYQTLDTKRVFDNHGRGIVMARSLAFESLIYHGQGNDVECIIPI